MLNLNATYAQLCTAFSGWRCGQDNNEVNTNTRCKINRTGRGYKKK